MNRTADITRLGEKIESFNPRSNSRERCLALAAAAICTGSDPLITRSFRLVSRNNPDGAELYELILQSYLFLGFPRMLSAAELFSRVYSNFRSDEKIGPQALKETTVWYERGEELCRRIYDSNFEKLRDRVDALSPEIFNWMILEGYGKVLSRPNLDIVKRELCIVAFLMMENREKQLHSHILGALNAGAEADLILQVVSDIGPAAGEGFEAAKNILEQMG